MKKLFFSIIIISLLFITGCMNTSKEKIKNNFIKETENLSSYYLEGTLIITNNDDTYEYDVQAAHQKEDYYKVTLQNKANGYEQTIVRNDEGVYVITPSLNKSFKFQSKWPYNNSQTYILSTIAKDLKDNGEITFEEKNDTYILTTKANYPNNPQYVKENIILDKAGNLKKVEVIDENNVKHIEFIVASIDKNSKFKDDYFKINEEKIEQENEEKQKDCTDDEKYNTKSTIDESQFPLYLPENTTLSNKEVITTDEGKRIIMTFSGDNPFILVQETIKPVEDLTIIPTYGEPFMLIDTVGSLTDISYTWISNGIEYYIVSDVMEKQELLEVAKSINVVSTIYEK